MKLYIAVMFAMLPDVEQEVRAASTPDAIQLVAYRYAGDAAPLCLHTRQDVILIYAPTPAQGMEEAQAEARKKWPESERWTAHAVGLIEVPRAALVEALRRVSDDDATSEPTEEQDRVM
jgi:hypothetical protein